MANCTICGGVAVFGKTCVLCSYGRFPDESPKETAKAPGDRHNPPDAGVIRRCASRCSSANA